MLVVVAAGSGSLPSAESACECAVQSFPAAFVSDFLLPYGDVGAVISGVAVQWRQRCAVEGVWRLFLLQVLREGTEMGAFVSHLHFDFHFSAQASLSLRENRSERASKRSNDRASD